MPYYQMYGINLTANVEIPGPLAATLSQDISSEVEVILGGLPVWLTQLPQTTDFEPNWYTPCRRFRETDVHTLRVWQIDQEQHFYCSYRDETTFVIDRQGTRIWATWPDDLTLEDTATYLLGPILGFVLRLRGVTCLHASAVVIEDQVIIFVGDAGAGKSTTAAAFAQRGYPVLSDDVVALVDQGNAFWVQPAYPRIRLWDTSVQALYGVPDALPRIVPTHPTWDKRYLDLTQPGYKFQNNPLPIAAIYLLGDRQDESVAPYVEPVPIQEQFISLVANTYTNYLLDKQMRAQEFEVLHRLVQSVPIRKITPHADPANLPQLVNRILKDFHNIRNSRLIPATG